MNDLISREKLISERPEWLNEQMEDIEKSNYNRGWNACNEFWLNALEEQPTAYNVNKVVEHLEYQLNVVHEFTEEQQEENETIGYMMGAIVETYLKRAIKIAQAGGVND